MLKLLYKYGGNVRTSCEFGVDFVVCYVSLFFFSSRRRHTRCSRDWSSDVCSSDLDGKPVRVSYVRSQISSAPANVKDEVEPAFVNDNYWFIFPFHAYWDTSAIVTIKDMQKLPLGKGSAKLVSGTYPPDVAGYTPRDTWDLYLGSDGRVKEFTYHRGGPK